MHWLQLHWQVDQTLVDLVDELLFAQGAVSVTLSDAQDQPLLEPLPGEMPLWDQAIVTGLFTSDHDSQRLIKQLQQQLPAAAKQAYQVELIEDQDWVRAWQAHYRPMAFGQGALWVCPSHLPPPQPEAVNLRLDPGLAFGTGTHPTTALCLDWLSDHRMADHRMADSHALGTVLDFGCGSGILAIAALLLGATSATGVDIDPQALTASQTNAEHNQVADQLRLLTAETFTPEPYDIVMANILATPLINLSTLLKACVKPGGYLVLSGLLHDQAAAVQQAYAPLTFTVTRQDDWVCLIAQSE